MKVRKTDAFLADIERQYEWYVLEAGWGCVLAPWSERHVSFLARPS
jgi:hypothetical protein